MFTGPCRLPTLRARGSHTHLVVRSSPLSQTSVKFAASPLHIISRREQGQRCLLRRTLVTRETSGHYVVQQRALQTSARGRKRCRHAWLNTEVSRLLCLLFIHRYGLYLASINVRTRRISRSVAREARMVLGRLNQILS